MAELFVQKKFARSHSKIIPTDECVGVAHRRHRLHIFGRYCQTLRRCFKNIGRLEVATTQSKSISVD
ncbi:hypothetical protein [Nostoc sp. CHAB 5715]|uniref:hypothetical protein n=1 Tax=Nostoc sp. CHAB 5715 TaxID=2780400 RepID=UPI001E2FA382|nr:hypothetical protein [Nostoc sp. CHAB 5715]MCC5622458.1 hypothetical protein [Nostoc sp. CHAB 5715]